MPLPALPDYHTAGTAHLGLGSSSCPSRGCLMPVSLCTDFVLREKEGTPGWTSLLSYTLFNGSNNLYFQSSSCAQIPGGSGH